MFKRILVAVDGSETSRQALAQAVTLAREQSAALRIVTVVDDAMLFGGEPVIIDVTKLEQALIAEADQTLRQAGELARLAGVNAETKRLATAAINQRIGDVVVAEAQQWPADLVVVGTHGRRGVSRLVLGSVAEGIARGCPVPVLLVRNP